MRDNPSMHAAFPFVVFGGIALFIIVGVLSMVSRGNSLYDQIGQGGLTLGDDRVGTRSSETGPPGGYDEPGGFGSESHSEREQEIRQMLQARSDRLVRSGQAPLDIDAELAKLAPAGGHGGAFGPGGESRNHDPGLTEEVRQLVLARNERRRRQGQDALDVDTEVARTLAELDP